MQERLYRIRNNRMIAGVSTGLAEYFDIDPVIIRLAFVISTFISGIGLIAYILLWIIVPEKSEIYASASNSNINVENPELNSTGEPQTVVKNNSDKKDRSFIFGLALIVIGFLFLADTVFPFFFSDKLWPLILVALGIILIVKSNNKKVQQQ